MSAYGMIKVRFAAIGTAFLLVAGSAFAREGAFQPASPAETTGSNSDTAIITYVNETGSDCSVVAPQFAVGGFSVGVMALGYLRLVDCGDIGPLTVSIGAGENFDGYMRNLTSGDASIPYKLIAADTGNEWGDGGAAGTYPGAPARIVTPSSNDDSLQIIMQFADDPANYPQGVYSDHVQITVEY